MATLNVVTLNVVEMLRKWLAGEVERYDTDDEAAESVNERERPLEIGDIVQHRSGSSYMVVDDQKPPLMIRAIHLNNPREWSWPIIGKVARVDVTRQVTLIDRTPEKPVATLDSPWLAERLRGLANVVERGSIDSVRAVPLDLRTLAARVESSWWPAPPNAPVEPAQQGTEVHLGVIELHSKQALREEFYRVVDDLQASASVVDLWLMDVQSVLAKHGYSLRVFRAAQEPASPAPGLDPCPVADLKEALRTLVREELSGLLVEALDRLCPKPDPTPEERPSPNTASFRRSPR